MAQAVADQFAANWVVGIESVSAAGEIAVVRALIGHQVIDGVLESFHGEDRPAFVTFAGMIQDHVEDDFDAGAVHFADELFKFIDLGSWRGIASVSAVGCEECHGVVAPIVWVFEWTAVEMQDGEFMDWHQFHGGDTQGLQVGDFFDQAQVGPSFGYLARGAFGETRDVQFVEDCIAKWGFGMFVGLPVEVVIDDDRFRRSDYPVA